jgi:hypothetical protein
MVLTFGYLKKFLGVFDAAKVEHHGSTFFFFFYKIPFIAQ